MASSSQKVNIARVLKEEGYISDYAVSGDSIKTLTIELKYYQGKPVIDTIKRISRPGLRIFRSKDDLPSINGGLGIAIISTVCIGHYWFGSRGSHEDRRSMASHSTNKLCGTVFQ